jgi:ribosomal protein S18 acetylase RimI-like enzyme
MTTDEVIIRPAKAGDHDDLKRGLIALQEYECALHEGRLDATASADPYLIWMLREIVEHDGLCLVASQGDSFIGFIAGWIEREENPAETLDSTTFGYISDICLLPAWRGLGFSKPLLLAMERYFAGKTVRRLRISALAANQPALAAYRSVGYQPYEVTLEKVLSAAGSEYSG